VLRYRPDIDGLRAIGVLAVVLFHLHAPYITGGFVGVDIFFVISGYLITKILADEIDNGGYSLVGFYERRIRRIIPALFVMLAVVSGFAYLTLIPYHYLNLAESAAAAALSISNVYFYYHSGYFDFGTEYIPLLHTWSLGVEEQFYIVFPLLFFYGRRSLRLSWKTIIFSLFLTSLAFCIVQTEFSLKTLLSGSVVPENTRNGAFFLPVSRSWEFLMGSALAIGAFPSAVNNHLLRNGLAWLGLGLILVSLFQFEPGMKFPGYVALLPCLGCALIIHANSGGNTAVGRLLGVYPMVWIGLISYSLYLWHWPLIAFMLLIWGGEHSLWVYLFLVALMLSISWLSWRFVERPFRTNPRLFTRRRLFATTAVAAGAFIGLGIFADSHDGLAFRFTPAALAIADGAKDGNPLGPACADKSDADIMASRVCAIGRSDVPITFALIGDSFADALTPAIDVAASAADRRGYVLTRGGCFALIGINSNSDCESFLDAATGLVRTTPSIKTIFLISRWTTAAEGSRFGAIKLDRLFITDAQSKERSYAENKAVFARALERDARVFAGYKVFIVAYIPEQLTNVPQAAALRVEYGRGEVNIPRDIVETRQESVRRLLTDAASHYGFTVLDAMQALCDADVCRAIEDGKSLYSDDNHLSRFGAVKESDLIVEAFKKFKPD
jgi:peptidoglycan/LPS O-acetylase OafA/YrhL